MQGDYGVFGSEQERDQIDCICMYEQDSGKKKRRRTTTNAVSLPSLLMKNESGIIPLW
jgi:hypothetical protein